MMSAKKIVIGVNSRVFIAIIFVLLIAVLMRNAKKETQVKKQIFVARADAEILDDKSMKDKIAFLQLAGIIKDKLISSKVDVCRIDFNGKSSYYQECYLRYIYGFATDMDKSNVMQRLQAPGSGIYEYESSELFGTPDETGCKLFRWGYKKGYEKSQYNTLYLITPVLFNEDGLYCEIPHPIKSDYSLHGAGLKTKIYRNFDEKSIVISQNQIWIEFEDAYYYEKLPCKFGSLFCTPTRGTPISAD